MFCCCFYFRCTHHENICNKGKFKWGDCADLSPEQVSGEIMADLVQFCGDDFLFDTTEKDEWEKRFVEFRDERIRLWVGTQGM